MDVDQKIADMIESGRKADTAGQRAWPNWRVADALEAQAARIAELEARLADESEMLTIAYMQGAASRDDEVRSLRKERDAALAGEKA
jgi:hypothetical protein